MSAFERTLKYHLASYRIVSTFKTVSSLFSFFRYGETVGLYVYLEFKGTVLVLGVKLVADVQLRLELLLQLVETELQRIHVLLMTNLSVLHAQPTPTRLAAWRSG